MASTIIGGSSVAFPAASAAGTGLIRGEYTTLSKVRNYLALGSAATADDNVLRDYIIYSSRAIDGFTRRNFFPQRKGEGDYLRFDLPDDRTTLVVDEEDLLEVKGLSDLNGASEIDTSVYWLKTGDRWNLTPYDRIVIDDSSGSLFNFSGTPQRAIRLDGVVGYHSQYNNSAWIDSGASLTSDLAETVTVASVSASGAFNAVGESPRFSQGQLWKMGSGSNEEFAYVQDTTDGNAVRLIRGINGTSAYSHAATTRVFTWQPERDIEHSATELAAFMYLKATAPLTNRVTNLQLGIMETPNTWPEQTLDRIKRYRKSYIYSF
jgi:hypothetical protein